MIYRWYIKISTWYIIILLIYLWYISDISWYISLWYSLKCFCEKHFKDDISANIIDISAIYQRYITKYHHISLIFDIYRDISLIYHHFKLICYTWLRVVLIQRALESPVLDAFNGGSNFIFRHFGVGLPRVWNPSKSILM